MQGKRPALCCEGEQIEERGVGVRNACVEKLVPDPNVYRNVIYRVQAWQTTHGEHNRYAVVPNALAGMVRQNVGDVDEVVRYTTASGNIRIGDELFNASISYADPAFFDLFTFTAKSGTLSLHDRSTILISDELAKKCFDREDEIGRAHV